MGLIEFIWFFYSGLSYMFLLSIFVNLLKKKFNHFRGLFVINSFELSFYGIKRYWFLLVFIFPNQGKKTIRSSVNHQTTYCAKCKTFIPIFRYRSRPQRRILNTEIINCHYNNYPPKNINANLTSDIAKPPIRRGDLDSFN